MKADAARPSVSAKPQSAQHSAEYGNWVSKRLVYLPFAVGIAFAASIYLSVYLIVPAAAFLIVAAYFAYARYLFSSKGRDVQGSIWAMLLGHMQWEGHGRALDIGCGSGAVTILLAKKYQDASVKIE